MINNIVHFVFGLKEQTIDFLFSYYLAILSAIVVNNPDKVYFYYHYEPKGKWWEKIKNSVHMVKVPIPTHFGKKPILKLAHKADYLRMKILYKYGGVYMDIDTICVKPYKELLKYDFVMGEEIPYGETPQNGLCNAIMFSKPLSEFLKIWMDNYEEYFQPHGWQEASVNLPYKLYKKYPEYIKVLSPKAFFYPNYNETQLIFEKDVDISKSLIILHLWESFSIKYIKNIKDYEWVKNNSQTLYGKIIMKNLERFKNYNHNNYVKWY